MNRRTESVGPSRGLPLGVRFFLLAGLAAGLMVADQRQQHLDTVRNTLAVALYPVQAAVDLPFAAWHWSTTTLSSRRALLEEIDTLRRRNLDSHVRLQRLDALEAENARLRAMMESSARVADRVLVAEILAVDMDPYRHRFTINKGERHRVYVGQALLDADGIMGQIVRVQPFTAEAILISDADHALPVTVNRNGLRTIATGTGDTDRLSLPFLPNSADIREGDLLVSSGLGGAFPSGYPVGRISRVERRPGDGFASVDMEPLAALNRAREVLLVWSQTANGELPEPSPEADLQPQTDPLPDAPPNGDAQ